MKKWLCVSCGESIEDDSPPRIKLCDACYHTREDNASRIFGMLLSGAMGVVAEKMLEKSKPPQAYSSDLQMREIQSELMAERASVKFYHGGFGVPRPTRELIDQIAEDSYTAADALLRERVRSLPMPPASVSNVKENG